MKICCGLRSVDAYDQQKGLEWWSTVKTTSHNKRDSDTKQHGELRSYRGSRLVKFVLWIFINFNDSFKTGEALFYIFFKVVFFTNDINIKWKMRLEQGRIELKVIPLQCLCQVSMLMVERRNPLSAVNPITSQFTKPTQKFPKTNKKRRPWQIGDTRCLPT